MKETLRQIVKMADIGLIKPEQLINLMDGVKVVFRGGKAETIVDGIYIKRDGRKHRFDVSEIRQITIDRGDTDPEVIRKVTDMDKLEQFVDDHMANRVKYKETKVDAALRMLQGYLQWQAGNEVAPLVDETAPDKATDNVPSEMGHLTEEHKGDSEDDRENPTGKTISSEGAQVQTPNGIDNVTDDGSGDGAAGIGPLDS